MLKKSIHKTRHHCDMKYLHTRKEIKKEFNDKIKYTFNYITL